MRACPSERTEEIVPHSRRILAGVIVGSMLAIACGGSSPNSPSPSPAPSPAPGPSPAPSPSGGVTFTITTTGVTPKSLTVAQGTRVTFVNDDTVAHDMSSDPHPDHTDCPELNQVGFLTPRQSRASGNLNTIRTCGFHDHNQPSNTSLNGQIIIQ